MQKLLVKKYLQFYAEFFCLSKPMMNGLILPFSMFSSFMKCCLDLPNIHFEGSQVGILKFDCFSPL